MANQDYLNPDNERVYRKARGTGTNTDPYVGEMDVTVTGGAPITDLLSRIGPINDPPPDNDADDSSMVGLLKRLAQRLTGILGSVGLPTDADALGDGSFIGIARRIRTLVDTIANRIPTLGQKTAAGSTPVVVASEQTTAAAPIAVRLSDGASFYAASGATGGTETSPAFVRGKMRAVRINPLVSTIAYSANDAISTLIDLPNVVPTAGRGTFLHSIQVNTKQTLSFLRCFILDDNPGTSTITDNEPVILAYEDQEKLAAWIDIDAGVAIDNTTWTAHQAASAALPKAIVPVSSTSLWLILQARSAVSFTGPEDLDLTLIFVDE